MKRFLLGISLLAMMTLAGCSSEEPQVALSDGFGYLQLNCSASDQLVTRAEGEVSFDVPTQEEFSLTIQGDGYEQTWNPFSTFVSADNRLKAGDYTASVVWGNQTSEGVNLPAYAGSTGFKIISQQVTSAAIKAELTKAVVTVTFTEQFLSYFHGEQVTLKTAAGNEFAFDSTTEDAIFVLPGQFSLSGKALKQTGEEFVIPSQNLTAEAGVLHPVKFDLKSAGTATIEISYNDTIIEEIEVTTELNPES